VIGFIVSGTATIVFAFNGLINYPYALALGLGSILGAWIRAGLGIKKGNNYIKILFLLIILITIAKLTFDFLK
jgi:uncharacterized membrane protein YfcA